MARSTPSTSSHTVHHVHAAQTPGGQPDHRPGTAPGETLPPPYEGNVCLNQILVRTSTVTVGGAM